MYDGQCQGNLNYKIKYLRSLIGVSMHYFCALIVLVVASPVRGAQDGREGWYLVKVIPGGNVTVSQHPMSEYGCSLQASIARKTYPEILAECVLMETPD